MARKSASATSGCANARPGWWSSPGVWINMEEKKKRGKPMSFAERLKQIRKEKGLSQEDLAELLDVSRQAVSKWEQGGSLR